MIISFARFNFSILILSTVSITGEIIRGNKKNFFGAKLVRPHIINQKSEVHVPSTTSRARAHGLPIFDAMFPSHFMRDQNLLIDSSK